MNIYDPYPTEVEYQGKSYRVNLEYDRVLRALDVQQDKLLTAQDKLIAQIQLLLPRPPSTLAECIGVLDKVFHMLPRNEESQERYIDLHQDAAIIRSAFLRLGIDLLKDKPHFFRFVEVLADLPSDTALMRIVDIRRRPIPKPTKHNREEIAELEKLKAKVAIKLSAEEQRDQFLRTLKNSTVMRRG